MGGMLQRIWMIGTLPRMANQCLCLLREGGQCTTCWLVGLCKCELCELCFTDLSLTKGLPLFLFRWRFCCPCCCCCLFGWSYAGGGSQWSKLVDRSWVTLCSEAPIPGWLTSAFPIGWLSSISTKHSDHGVKSGCCPSTPTPRWSMRDFFIVKEVYVLCVLWTHKHTHKQAPFYHVFCVPCNSVYVYNWQK